MINPTDEITLEHLVEKYRDLYENAPDMFVSVDAKTSKIIECNRTTINTLCYSKDEIIGKLIAELYHPSCEKKRQKVFKTFITKGEVRNAELLLKRKDGSTLDVSLNITSVRDENNNVLYSRSSWRDITKQKRIEDILHKRTHALRERVKELNCLYKISSLTENHDLLLEEILQKIVELIPPSWQYHEHTCARIIRGNQEYRTNNFQKSSQVIRSKIILNKEQIGLLEVFYMGKTSAKELKMLFPPFVK